MTDRELLNHLQLLINQQLCKHYIKYVAVEPVNANGIKERQDTICRGCGLLMREEWVQE